MLSLPAIRRAGVGRDMLAGYAVFVIIYLSCGAWGSTRATLLQPTTLDHAVPYLSWSVWVYLSQFALLPIALLTARSDTDRSRAFYAMLLATVMAAVVFLAWPTRLERMAAPASGISALAWQLLYLMDTPGNCFPSLHVALAVIAGWALWRRGWRVVAVLWPAVILLSTLTTRQHVLWDVAGGVMCATAALALTPYLVTYERSYPTRYPGRA